MDGNKWLFNSPEMSDIRFLVDGETVYGHKVILAMGSPVFEVMFFGQLKEKRGVIEIKDLTPLGFKNALRYLYGFEIDFKPYELYESYVAADKYLVHDFKEAFLEYIKRKLTARNSCPIYGQLMKIGDPEEISLAHVRKVIIESSKEAFESEHFMRIGEKTLISLLSLDKLNIDESDLFAAVSKWMNCGLQREGLPVNDESRRKLFEKIKPYIRFSDLKPDKIASCKEIVRLFTAEELAPLLLHLLDKANPLMIEPITTRKSAAGAKLWNPNIRFSK